MSKRESTSLWKGGRMADETTLTWNNNDVPDVPWERVAVSNERPMHVNRPSTLVRSIPNKSPMTLSQLSIVGVSHMSANNTGGATINDNNNVYNVNHHRVVGGGFPIGHGQNACHALDIITNTSRPPIIEQVAPSTSTLDLLLLQAHLCHQQQQQRWNAAALTAATMTHPGPAPFSRTAGTTMTAPVSMSNRDMMLSSSSLRHANRTMMTPSSSQIPRDQYATMHASTAGADRSGATLRQATGAGTMGSEVIAILPRSLTHSMDELVLSSHQVYLREQIEYFQATHIDATTKIIGRIKCIVAGQVGIRCRHCAHVPIQHRQVGSAYFPASIKGLYQAAQNMCTTHLQCGRCVSTPDSVKNHFKHLLEVAPKIGRNSMGGRAYWAQCAKELGLVDTNHGIFVQNELPQHVDVLPPS